MTSNSALNVGFGVSGQVLTSNGPGLSPTYQTPGSGSLSLGYATGQYYLLNTVGTSSGTQSGSVSADELRIVPFAVSETNTFDRFDFQVSSGSAAGTSCRLGIYNSVDGLPGTVFVDFGTVVTDANGVKTITINQAFTAGYYWAAVHSEGTTGVLGFSATTNRGYMIPQGTSFLSTGVGCLRYTAYAWASGLPNLTGVSPTVSNVCPIFMMRST